MLVINRPFPVCRLFVASVLAINRFFPVCRLFVVSMSANEMGLSLVSFSIELEKVFVCFTESLFVSLRVFFVCFTESLFVSLKVFLFVSLILF